MWVYVAGQKFKSIDEKKCLIGKKKNLKCRYLNSIYYKITKVSNILSKLKTTAVDVLIVF